MGALAISDLTPMAGEPRVRDKRLSDVLGYDRPSRVRDLIGRNRDEILDHGSLPQISAMIETGKGARRAVEEYHLNEAQALLVCMFARTEKAAAVRKQVIEVFLAWRRGELTDIRPDATVETLNRLEQRLAAMESVGQRLRTLVLDPLESALALTHVVDLWFHSSRQRRPKFWSDVEVRGLILAAHRQMRLDECRQKCSAMFGEARTPSRSAIHRFWMQLDRLRGQYPSPRAH